MKTVVACILVFLTGLLCLIGSPPARSQAQAPELVVQTGHTSLVSSIVFRADGALLVSGGNDGRVVVWDVATSKQLCTFTADGDVQQVAFLHSGGQVASLGNSLSVFDITSRQRVRHVITPSALLWAVDAERDRAAEYDGAKISFLSLITGERTGSFTAPTSVVGALLFSPDGRELIIGAGGKQEAITPGGLVTQHAEKSHAIFVYDLARGQIVRTLNAASPIIDAAAFSPDGRLFGASSSTSTQYMNTRQEVAVEVWDWQAGQRVKSLRPEGKETPINPLTFNHDSTLLAGGQGGALMSNDNSINLWNLRTGELLSPLLSQYKGAYTVAFQKSGDILASSGLSPFIVLWDAARQREFGQLRGHAGTVVSAQMCPGGVLAVTTDWCMQFWDTTTGHQIRTIRSRFYKTVQSEDGRGIAAKIVPPGESDLRLAVYDTTSGAEQCLLPAPPIGTDIYSFCLSADDTLLACVMSQSSVPKTIEVWDVATGRQVCNFPAPSALGQVKFRSDGPVIKAETLHGAVFYDARTGKPASAAPLSEPTYARPLDIGDQTWGFSSRTLTISGYKTGQPDLHLVLRDLLSDDGFTAHAYVQVWSGMTQTEVFALEGSIQDINSMAVTADRRFLITASKNGDCCFWDLASKKKVATFTPIDQSEWIFWTPDGYYFASRNARAGVGFRLQNRAFPLEQFDLRLNRPDKSLEALGGPDHALIAAYHAAYLKRLEKTGFTEAQFSSDFHLPALRLTGDAPPLTTPERTLRFSVTAADDTYLLDRVQVFVNDVPANFTFDGKPGSGSNGLSLRDKNGKQAAGAITLELSAGANKVQVSALNSQDVESLRQTFNVTCTAPAPKPDLYVLAVGVSTYKDGHSLASADKDAQAVSDFFAGQASHYGHRHILTLLNAQAVKEDILKAKDFLMPSSVDDEVIVFFAGHGLLDDKMDYYFATSDVTFNDPSVRGLGFDGLHGIESLLDGIPARHKLLLMDTCHAGEVDKPTTLLTGVGPADPAKRGTRLVTTSAGLNNAFELQGELFADLRRGSGATVIAAARGVETAGENTVHGYFTRSVLDALQANPHLKVSELRDAVAARIDKETEGRQRPTARRENLEDDFAIVPAP